MKDLRGGARLRKHDRRRRRHRRRAIHPSVRSALREKATRSQHLVRPAGSERRPAPQPHQGVAHRRRPACPPPTG
jgi:hypothetical protein